MVYMSNYLIFFCYLLCDKILDMIILILIYVLYLYRGIKEK